MALTGLTNLQPLHIKTVGIGTFDNAVSIGGTLTYEDVTNVDAIGIITARSGINVSGGQLDVGNNIKLGNAGVITATSFVGSGSGLTGISGVSVANQADNRLITATGTSDALNGEANLKFDGTNLDIDSDSGHLRIGDDQDLDLYHNGSNGYLKNSTGQQLYRSGTHTFENAAGSTEYLRITSGGVLTFPTAGIGLHNSNTNSYFFSHGSNETRLYHAANAQIKLSFRGTGDTLRGAISADANGMHILTAGSGEQVGVKCITNDAVELYHNGNRQVFTIDGGMNWQDNKKAEFGASGDLKLYHNGTDSYISNGTNNLRIGNTHNNNIKFFTQGNTRWNINGDGHIIPDSNNTFDIGASSYRVRNIYTADLHCSNKGSSNDVDGTWGDYTIQEGESDLFLINNRSGKKYKFNLTEVS